MCCPCGALGLMLVPPELLPDRLVHQALAIAQKVDKMIAGRVGKKDSRKTK